MPIADQFIDEQQALKEFKRILVGMPGYERLEDAQIIEAMSLFQSWSLRQANWRAERAHQEGFMFTANQRSSVLAHAESRQYVARKPTPSRGPAVFVNRSSAPVSLPAGTQWVGSNQLPYLTTDDVIVPPGGRADAEVVQASPERYTYRVESRRPFYEILLDREASTQVSEFTVSVDGERWVMMPRLMNTAQNSAAYDEFYTALDEIGIRFGNGVFGRIPGDGAEVVVDVLLTHGETSLLGGQELRYVTGSSDPNIGMIEAQTGGAITGGRGREDIEEIRRNALYYPLYDEQLVWQDDYTFVIRRMWPEVVWTNVWGEQEQEQAYGPSLDHIGNIYVSAYAPGRPDVLSEIVSQLEEPISRRFVPVPPNFKPLAIRLEGEIERHIPLAKAIGDVEKLLLEAYGKDSKTRRDRIKLKDFYRLISSTGHFEMGDFSVEIFGDQKTNGLNDVVYLDWSLSEIQVEYTQ